MSSQKASKGYTITLDDDFLYTDSKIDSLLWYAYKMPVSTKMTLDFSKIQYLRPEAVIMLIVFSRMMNNKVKCPIIWTHLPRGGRIYLNRIGIDKIEFVQVEKDLLDYLPVGREQKSVTNLMPLEIVQSDTQLNIVIKSIRDKLGEWFPGRPSSFSNEVCTILSEIAGNSLEHSVGKGQIPTCYVTLQRYKPAQNDTPKAIIALGDTGMGIGNSLRNANKLYGKDLTVIQRAFYNGISSRSGSGGLGFFAISNLLSKNGGRITIRSGTGSIQYSPQYHIKKGDSHKYSLIGTQTSFLL